jgi:hypothetical protein
MLRSAHALMKHACGHSSLEQVTMRKCGYDDSAIGWVIQWLRSLPELRKLALMGGEGGKQRRLLTDIGRSLAKVKSVQVFEALQYRKIYEK